MRSTPLFSKTSSFRKIEASSTTPKDTAYWIFDRRALFTCSVNKAHLTMANNKGDLPIAYNGTRRDLERVVNEQVPITARIIDMVNYFRDGASIGLTPEMAGKIYKRITEHFSAHIKLSRSEMFHMLPDIEDFREMAEFALSIRNRALVDNPELDRLKFSLGAFGVRARPSVVSRNDLKLSKPGRSEIIPKALQQMDDIEKYYSMFGG